MRKAMFTRWASLMVLLVLVAGLMTSFGWAIPENPRGDKEKTPDLIILYTGNVSGYIEPCG